MTFKYSYPKNVEFCCRVCGQCCKDTKDKIRKILLLKTDVNRISKQTSIEYQEFVNKRIGSKLYAYQMIKTEDGKCFFLKNNRCSIYQIRPLICRFFPFEIKNLGNKRYVFLYTKKCKGIKHGNHTMKEFFKRLFNKFINEMEKNIGVSIYH